MKMLPKQERAVQALKPSRAAQERTDEATQNAPRQDVYGNESIRWSWVLEVDINHRGRCVAGGTKHNRQLQRYVSTTLPYCLHQI